MKNLGKNASENPIAVAKLKVEVEKAKKILSSIPETRITIENFYNGHIFLRYLLSKILRKLIMPFSKKR